MVIDTPTDALIAVMEHADNLQSLVIIGMTKENKLLMCSTAEDPLGKLGLLELAKFHVANSSLNA